MMRTSDGRDLHWRLMFTAVVAAVLQGCMVGHPGAGGQLDSLVKQGFSDTPTGVPIRVLVAERLGPSRRDSPAPEAGKPTATLNVYIEGDGAAWVWGLLPPENPTPRNAVALQMARLDRGAQVAYVGRPCQFLELVAGDGCHAGLWADGRFGEVAMAMTAQALDSLLAGFPADQRMNLIGFSGGGTLALLVAAERTDVDCVVTVASPLDTDAWADLKKVRRLSTSMNPAEPNRALSRIRQTHLYSEADTVVPLASVGRYANWQGPADVKFLHGGPRHGHWAGYWSDLMAATCLNASASRYNKFSLPETGAWPDSINWRVYT